MLLAVIILVASGVYVCFRKEVQASSKFVIRGRPARNIGIVLVLGGVLAVVLPAVLGALKLLTDLPGQLLLSIATMFGSLVCIAVMMRAEKRRQTREPGKPTGGEEGRSART